MSDKTRAHAKVEQASAHPKPKNGSICQPTLSGWQDISTAPEGIKVRVRIDDAHGLLHEQTVVRRKGQLWFSGDMYVYFQPTHWQPLPAPPTDGEPETRDVAAN